MLPTAVATFIGAYALGVRDRHKDNMGFTGTALANIDFGWLGESPGFNIPGFGRRVEMDTGTLVRSSVASEKQYISKQSRNHRVFRRATRTAPLCAGPGPATCLPPVPTTA